MFCQSVLAAAVLAAGASAQFVTSSPDSGVQYAINVPSDTASSTSGPIFFNMQAPAGTQWLGLGQGGSMSGANIFMLYSDGNGNVTVSPRFGQGNRQPTYSSGDTSITVLSGSSSNSDGSMVANVRCDGCISWPGGNMDPTSSSSSWIWAIKDGSPIDSTDLSENLQQHDSMGTMTIDLTQGTGGNSANPFVSGSGSSGSAVSSSAVGSASTTSAGSAATTGASTSGISSSAVSQSGTASVTNLVPAATSTGSSSSSSTTSSSNGPKDGARSAHGVIMSILFLLFFPFFALTLYLPWAKRVRFVHAPLQILSIIFLIIGLSTGVVLGKSIDMLDGYHQVIGYIIVACMVFFQPALGIYQHLHYHKTGGRSALGVVHQWLGRIVILAGVVNGGLGFLQAGPVGSEYVPHGAVAAYSIIAVVVFIMYIAVVFISKRRAQNSPLREKPYDRGYEMHPSSNDNTTRPFNTSYQQQNQYQNQNYFDQRQQYR